jgi:hypothetical protein
MMGEFFRRFSSLLVHEALFFQISHKIVKGFYNEICTLNY